MLFITGCTGFIGGHLLKELQRSGFTRVKCLARNPEKISGLPFNIVHGDIENISKLNAPLKGVKILIHLAAVIHGNEETINRVNVESLRALIDEAKRAGVEKVIFLSTEGVNRDFRGPYEDSKLKGEKIITDSGIKYTILRPGMVYGPGGSGYINLFIRILKKYPVVPVIGSGKYKKQPVYVSDVVSAILCAADNPVTDNRIYEIGGGSSINFNEMIETICDVLGIKRIKLIIPERLLLGFARLAKIFAGNISFELKIRHACRDSLIDYSGAERDFGFTPIDFRKGLNNILRGQE